MADQRLGRAGGANIPSGVHRRPAFRDQQGETYEADNALDAGRASGAIRGDLRGTPSTEPPGSSYVTRRRPAVKPRQAPQRQDDGGAEDDQGQQSRDYADEDPRGNRRTARDPRAAEDRQFSEDRELTDDERVAMLRQGFFQVALPDLPKKPGWHRCWLTTTNPRDPIAARIRAGYRLLKVEDLGPGWEQQKATSGEHPGTVMINEMIAAEVSETLYQRFMHELHHNMPREQERGIYGRLEAHSAALVEKGSRLIFEDEEENALARMQRGNRAPAGFE